MPERAPVSLSPGAVFTMKKVIAERRESGELYTEFLRRDSMSLEVYGLPAGGTDPQSPHGEDEVYLVLEGRGVLRIGEEDHPMEPGSLAFVAARVPHRFHTITEDLEVLVFFAPPLGSSDAADVGRDEEE